MLESLKHIGVFDVWDHHGLSNEQLSDIFHTSGFFASKWLTGHRSRKNLLMASSKLLMANAVYPTIDKLVITNQTTTPADDETSYSGAIYTTVASEEFSRTANANPYVVSWNILDDNANGSWGSFVLINASGGMINRALAGLTKNAGVAKLVQFTGEVTG